MSPLQGLVLHARVEAADSVHPTRFCSKGRCQALQLTRARLKPVHELNQALRGWRPGACQPRVQRRVTKTRITSELLLRETTLSHGSTDKPSQFVGFVAFDLALACNQQILTDDVKVIRLQTTQTGPTHGV